MTAKKPIAKAAAKQPEAKQPAQKPAESKTEDTSKQSPEVTGDAASQPGGGESEQSSATGVGGTELSWAGPPPSLLSFGRSFPDASLFDAGKNQS